MWPEKEGDMDFNLLFSISKGFAVRSRISGVFPKACLSLAETDHSFIRSHLLYHCQKRTKAAGAASALGRRRGDEDEESH